MANSNKVFVSPGVYTSEKDLTFVAQSVGVTTLGLAGETLKGPANEPILISSFDEFKTYFGGTSPEKDAAGNPKYELPYVAKAYLQESNQLFVTRVLGKTGYKPFNTFGIKTIGGLSPVGTGSTLAEKWQNSIADSTSDTMDPQPLANMTGSTFYAELSNKTAENGQTITEWIRTNYSAVTGNDGVWFVIGLADTGDVASQDANKENESPLTGFRHSSSNDKIGRAHV